MFGSISELLVNSTINQFNKYSESKLSKDILDLLVQKAKEGYIPKPDSLLKLNIQNCKLFVAFLHREIGRCLLSNLCGAPYSAKEVIGAYLEFFSISLVLMLKEKVILTEEILKGLAELNLLLQLTNDSFTKSLVNTIEIFIERILSYVNM